VKQPFINVEEKIDKVVGRRTKTPDAFESGMKLQSLAVELHRSLKQRWAPNRLLKNPFWVTKTCENPNVFEGQFSAT
jgi:hypothetical protein